MNVPRNVVAISIDHDRLVALTASVGLPIRVKTLHTAMFPPELNLKDATAVGRWIGTELEQVGIPRGKVLISVPRGEVILKRLRLPKADEGELAGMVQLQMAKQMTMAAEGTAVDFVPLSPRDGAVESESVSVLAAALPGDRIAWYRAMIKAAGCKIDRLGLRSSGLASVLAQESERYTGPVLGIAAGWGSVEFAVVEHGELVFVRAADFGIANAGETEQAFVQRVGVEVKRTWMSYRVGENTGEVDAVMVAGEGELATELARHCGEALEMAWKLAPLPGTFETKGRISEADKLVAGPLIGLISEEASGRPTLDFAHPRKTPDYSAIRRQRVLAAVFGVIVVGGLGYVLASGELSKLRAKVAAETDAAGRLRTQYAAMLKDDARLGHLQQWTRADFDWLAHTRWISETMPETREAQLQQLSAGLAAEVEFVPKDGAYTPGGWRLRQVAKFTLEGRTKRRETANELRERLVGSTVYQVETQGADVQDQFRLNLATTKPVPEVDAPRTRGDGKPAASAEPKEGGE